MKHFLRHAALALTGAVVGLAAAVPAHAAPAASATAASTANQWRVAWRAYGIDNIDTLAAIGPKDAWATGHYYLPGHSSPVFQPYVLHWDGTSWRRVTLPGGSGWLSNIVSASSPTNVWVFAENKAGQQRIFRYDGHWSSMTAPSDPGIDGGALLLGPNNAWAVASAGGCNGLTFGSQCFSTFLHWDGVTWKSYQLNAVLTSISGTAKTGLWAAGFYDGISNGLLTVFHWDGTTWVPVKVPHLPATNGTPSIAVESAKSIWVTAAPEGKGAGGSGGRYYILHWNGSTWRQIATPATEVIVGPTPDGHGGVWVSMYHYTGSSWIDTWKTAPAGFAADGPVKVPGTASSYWAPGVLYGPGTTGGAAIYLYGPKP